MARIEDPARHTYIRPEGGGLMVGLFEPDAAAWALDGVSADFSFGELEPDWERMAPFVEAATGRVPACESAGVKKFFCGPESFTPDGAPLVGESPELDRFYVGAGLNSIGVLTAGGLGRALARWVKDGKPPADTDVTGVSVARALPHQANRAFRAARVVETLGEVYACHYPYKSAQSARGGRRSPAHAAHVAAGELPRRVGREAADWLASSFDATRARARTRRASPRSPRRARTWAGRRGSTRGPPSTRACARPRA